MASALRGASSRFPRAYSRSIPDRCLRRCSASSVLDGSIPSGGRPKTRAAPSFIRLRARGRSSWSLRLQTGTGAPPRSRGSSKLRFERMSLWRQFTSGLRVLTNRTAADRELAEELDDYLAQTRAALEASGLNPEEAHRVARRQVGNPMVVREQFRSSGWENILETFFADLRYAARQLRNNPGFATTAILILGLGIGATTAIFSAINPILFQPLPFPHPDRVVMIFEMRD